VGQVRVFYDISGTTVQVLAIVPDTEMDGELRAEERGASGPAIDVSTSG
jgi:hypothetical protein